MLVLSCRFPSGALQGKSSSETIGQFIGREFIAIEALRCTYLHSNSKR
jgi:hypothetical protein